MGLGLRRLVGAGVRERRTAPRWASDEAPRYLGKGRVMCPFFGLFCEAV